MNKGTIIKRSILIADDDADDREMLKAAFAENNEQHDLAFVENGEELMVYLHRKNEPLPGIILLDLNMPKKDGREALREIRADKLLRAIPVVILTTSIAQKDVQGTYELGVNSFVIKPGTFKGLIEFTKIFSRYWFDIAQLPQITG